MIRKNSSCTVWATTTTISMIAGLLPPDAGRVRVDGMDIAQQPADVKRRLGVVPQEIALYEDLTAKENLDFWGGVYGLSGSALAARREPELRAAVAQTVEPFGDGFAWESGKWFGARIDFNTWENAALLK